VSYARTYFLLLLLLGLALGVSFLNLGDGNLVASMGIAIAKALLIMYFFMHLKVSPALTRYVAYVGVVWLSVLFGLALTDYVSRRWHPLPGTWPQQMPNEAGEPVQANQSN
jgi:cytochrome c oxidase subunit IV